MQMGQKRQASCQSAYNVGKRGYKARLPGIYRSALAKRAYRGFKSAVSNRAYRGVETREVSPTGDLWWRGFKARLQTNAAARMLLQTLTLG